MRAVDRFTVPKVSGPLPPGVQLNMIQRPLEFTLVVALKSGDLGSGKHDVTIRLQKPDMTYVQDNNASVFFSGGEDNGALFMMPIAIVSPEEGLHWFDVLFDGNLITRIPMRVLHTPAILQVPFQPPPEGH